MHTFTCIWLMNLNNVHDFAVIVKSTLKQFKVSILTNPFRLKTYNFFRKSSYKMWKMWVAFLFVFVTGLRLGKIYESTTPQPNEPNFQWTITFPFYVPKRLVAVGLVQLYLEKFDYGIDRAFKQLNCNSKVIKLMSEFIPSSVIIWLQ